MFDYYTIGRDAEEARKVDPYHLLYKGGQFYLIGYSHERDDTRVFRVSRIRGKVGYSSKAEHDFNRPEEFDPRDYATRTDWQLGDPIGRARIWLSDRIDWLALRHFGHAGEVTETDDGVVFETDYANARQMVAWVLGLGEHARVEGPPELVEEWRQRLELIIERHAEPAGAGEGGRARREEVEEDEDRESSPIRPERFARLVTLAGILIDTAREARKLDVAELCERLQVSRPGAAPGHRRAQRRELRRRLATSSTPRSRATRSRSTPSPTATTSPAPPGCCRSRRRRWWPRST